MHRHVGDVGTGVLCHTQVGLQHDLVDLALAGVELAAHRCGAGEVGGIIVLRLGAGVAYHHAAFFQHVVVAVVVQRLSVHAEDDGERHGAAAREREPFDHAGDLLFHHARLAQLHGGGVHVIGGVGGPFHLGDLEFALDLAHGDDGLDEVEADIVGHLVEVAVQPLGHLDLRVGPVSGQDVDLASLGQGLLNIVAEAVEVAAVGDADAVALFLKRGERSAPNHVVDGDLHTEEDLFAGLEIDDAHQVGMVQPEVVGEVAVLTVDIGVVRVVERSFVVGGEEGDAFVEHLFQCGSAAGIYVFIEHVSRYFCE